MIGELSCKLCKKRVDASSMKYAKDGSGLVCSECSEKQSGKLKVPMPQLMKEAPKTVRSAGKIEFRCKACSYKFSRTADYYDLGQKVCPMCGKETLMSDLPKDADELLRKLDFLD